jgi:ABC-type enterochelin transport system permease subunit
MEDYKNGSPLVLLIAWLNYLISHVFTMPFLNKVALILSIMGSIVYIVTSLHKFFKKYE